MRRYPFLFGFPPRAFCAALIAASLVTSLAGCGQYGQLYLRDNPPANYKPPKPKPPKPVPYPAELAPAAEDAAKK